MRRPHPLLPIVETVAGFVILLVFVTVPGCKAGAQAHPATEGPADKSTAVADKAVAAADTTPPPGVDISKLDDFGKKVFFRIANSEASVCGQAQSLIKSAKDDKGCRRSVSALRYVAHLVGNGFTDSEVSEALAKRYRPVPPRKIDIADAPMKGAPGAKITLVEFADYECPHCKRFQPVLRQIVDEFHGDVKLYFKHYPLPQHNMARAAAEAAVAAQKQGKFWQYQDKIWDQQDDLTPAKLESAAKEIGLDLTKFRQDMASEAVKAKVQKDRADGSAAGLQATPTLYIDGREYTDGRDTDSLREWIKDEIAAR
jgi:protein-disulfide isomerase